MEFNLLDRISTITYNVCTITERSYDLTFSHESIEIIVKQVSL